MWKRLENPGFLGIFFLSEICEGSEKKVGRNFWDPWKIPGKIKGGKKKKGKTNFGIKTSREFQEIEG